MPNLKFGALLCESITCNGGTFEPKHSTKVVGEETAWPHEEKHPERLKTNRHWAFEAARPQSNTQAHRLSMWDNIRVR